MEDAELIELQKEEKKLINKILDARNKLANRVKGSQHAHLYSNLLLPGDKNNGHLKESPTAICDWKILSCASRFLGISFHDCLRKWLDGQSYMYKTLVKSKALIFQLDVSICLGDKGDFMIDSINCDFVNIEKYMLNEILPWVQKISTQKNLSLLFSAIYEYNEKITVRSKFLSKVKQEKYGSLEECQSEKGGVIVHIHSPKNPEEIYLQLHWVLLFSEWSLQIIHFFTINSTDVGRDFVEANQNLLQDFCASSISKDDLLQLWSSLFAAVDTYESNK